MGPCNSLTVHTHTYGHDEACEEACMNKMIRSDSIDANNASSVSDVDYVSLKKMHDDMVSALLCCGIMRFMTVFVVLYLICFRYAR